jgi:thiol:disulfide interchange protein DsbD
MNAFLRVLTALFIIVPAAPVLIAQAAPAYAAESEAVRSPRATATLVSDTDRIAPGIPFHVGLRLRMAEGWHTYWVNPGDAGIAPELTWTLPAGAAAGPVAWPAPERQPEGSLMTYGYSGDLLLAVPITGPAHTVRMKASWLVCKDICVPEEGEFRLELPQGPPAASKQAPLFASSAASAPRPSPFTARVAPDGTLTIAGEAISARSVRDAWFIPAAADTVVGPAPQPLRTGDGRFSLGLRPGAAFRADAPLEGVLFVRDAAGQQSALSIAAAPGGPGAEPAPSQGLPLWRILGLAAAGGLILNLMPCVFPVLAMKAVSLAGLSGAGRRHATAHAFSYTAGIIVTFLLVGFALLALRAAGDAAGWGFQFQSPAFVAAITWVLFAVGLNLSGVYEVQTASAGVGQRLAARGGHVGSFFTGLLAVLVATPCTAPFMGVAIGAALATSSPAVTVAVFAAMGLGLAAPYVVLATVPVVGRIMPRPGRWMDVLRQGLAFPMYGTCVWLVWVMSQEAGSAGVLGISSGLVLIGFTGWAFGLGQRAAGHGRRIARAAALAGALAALAVLSGLAATPAVAPEQVSETGVERFSAERLAALRDEGRPVFVNMTAAWCVTCLVNERVALAQPAVRQLFATRGVVYLKGDWTRQDPQITAFLRSHGRDGVPLYALYPPGHAAPVLLPQILTEAGVIEALERIGE